MYIRNDDYWPITLDDMNPVSFLTSIDWKINKKETVSNMMLAIQELHG